MRRRGILRCALRALRSGRASFPVAVAGSLALHGMAVAATLWLGRAVPETEPTTLHSFAVIVAEAAPSAGPEPAAERPARAAPTGPTATAPAEPMNEAAAPRRGAPAQAAAPAPPAVGEALPPSSAAAPRPPPPAMAPPPRKPAPPAAAERPPAPAETVPPSRAPQLAARAPERGSEAAAAEAGAFAPPRYGLAGLANPHPSYPWASRQRGEEGRVVVRVAVDALGKAAHVELAQSSGHARLDRAALRTIRGWRFAPARAGGRPVPGTVEVPVTFRITSK